MKRTVIAGGTGLIGRQLAQALVEAGHEVVVLSRNPGRRGDDTAPGVRTEKWDGITVDGWGPQVDGAHAVVNLAGESIASGRWTASRKARIRDSRVRAAAAIAQAVGTAGAKPAVVVHGSAVGFYGPRGSEEVGEDGAHGNDFLADVTRAAEAAIAPVADDGVRLVIARTGVVFDKTGGALPRMLQPLKLGAGGRVGSGKQYLPWIHIADEVGALRFLIENETATGVYNLTAPEPVTNSAFAEAAGRALGRPSLVPAPAFAMRLAFGEMATVLLDGQRAVPRRLLEAGYTFAYPDLDRCLSDLVS